jgi:hypothetical protein
MHDEVDTAAALLPRIEELEQRIERLEQQPATGSEDAGPIGESPGEEPAVTPGDDPHPCVGGSGLLADDWTQYSVTLNALGHPLRLQLLRQVLAGAGTVAELQEIEGLGTTGRLYHHLRQLLGAGWLRSTTRGRYAIPDARVAPLLVILLAVERGFGPETQV